MKGDDHTHQGLISELVHLGWFGGRREELAPLRLSSLLRLQTHIVERLTVSPTGLLDVLVDAELIPRTEWNHSNRMGTSR